MIAYITNREITLDSGVREGRAAIFIVSPEDGRLQQIGPELKGAGELCWMPDSQHLTYRGPSAKTIALDGSEVRSIPCKDLPNINVMGSLDGYSPDGKIIYYVDDRPGEEGNFAVSREGGTPWRLTQSKPEYCNGPEHHLQISPDGQALAYVTGLDGERGIYIFPTSGGEPQLLVKIGETMPRWSPDGSQLAYADGSDLYIISASGGQPYMIVHLDPLRSLGGHIF